MKQRVSVYRHGVEHYVGVDTFFASHPGSTDTSISEILSAPSDAAMGRAVLQLLGESGVLDPRLSAKGEPGRSYVAARLGLPSDAVLSTETVLVSVTRRGGRLLLEPMVSEGAGGGFGGDLATVELNEGTDAAIVGASVRECADLAAEASASVLRPAGSWRTEMHSPLALPTSGAVTVRRAGESWMVTARIDAGGGGQSGKASSTVECVRRDAAADELGRVVVEVLALATGRRPQPGEAERVGGERQVLVEAVGHGLTIYPQAICGDTGAWDVPAHQSARHVPQQATLGDVGRAVALAADELPEW